MQRKEEEVKEEKMNGEVPVMGEDLADEEMHENREEDDAMDPEDKMICSVTPVEEVREKIMNFRERMKRQIGNASWEHEVKKMHKTLEKKE